MAPKVILSRRTMLVVGVLLAGAIAACSTEIYAPAALNPPPSEPFNAFGRYQLQPVTLNPKLAEHGYNQSATAAINRELQPTLATLLNSWDKGSGRMLLVAPYIEEIKFIGGAARFWGGAMAGSSAVVIRVTYTDEATGKTVATPVFYQHANAMGGAFSFGGTDNAMLSRIANLITDYTRNNYAQAVGGPTGAPANRVRDGN